MHQQTLVVGGVKEAAAAAKKIRDNTPGVWAAGLYFAATNVMTTALPITPADTGWLRASRFVLLPEVQGDRAQVALGFGASYASYVHNIFKRYVTGEWKFLQTAIDHHAPTFLRDATRFAEALLRKGEVVDINSVRRQHPTQVVLDPVNQAALEGLNSRNRRRRSERVQRRRLLGQSANVDRLGRESAAGLSAQRSGRQAPRPGRG